MSGGRVRRCGARVSEFTPALPWPPPHHEWRSKSTHQSVTPCIHVVGSQGDRLHSQLTCYPYHQQHKILDGRGEDLFCEASNVVIDFSKVGGTVSPSGKPGKGSEYLRFGADSLLATCRKTEHYDPRLFMPHHSLQMHTFRNDFQAADGEELVEHAATTYLLARDEGDHRGCRLAFCLSLSQSQTLS